MLQVMDNNSHFKKITENTLLKFFFPKKTVFKDVWETASTTQYKRRRECWIPVQDTNTAQLGNQAEATISQRMELGIYTQSGFF